MEKGCFPDKDQEMDEEWKNDCIKSRGKGEKKVRKSKRRIAGLFLKAEKAELSSCLKEGRYGRRMKTGKGNSGEDSGALYQG